MGSRLWKFLTTDIRELASQEAVENTADAAEAVLDLAEVLQEEGPKLAQLAPLVSQLDSLLDILNSPLGAIAGATLPFLPIATGLLKVYRDTTKKEPTVAQSVALVSQAAYLETVKTFLAKPKVKVWLAKVGDRPGSSLIKQRLKNLDEWTLDDKEARRALLYFHESKLAVAYGEILTARLVELGLKGTQATKIADKLARQTNRMMRPALVQCNDSVKALVKWLHIGGKEDFEKYLSIDTYLEEVIAPKPYDKVFAESFTCKDIYVPLKAQLLTRSGKHDEEEAPVVLDQWAQTLLNDDQKKDQVMFVQGGPGRGKSMFCRMLADWVRRHEYPHWTPILIRLWDVSVLSRDFEETLGKAVDRDFVKTDSGWLTDRNINYFFILDGFDELLMEGRTSGGLDNFLDQVGRFQEQCAHSNFEKGHRVLITGRTLALQSIESRMPSNLMRVEILPMDDEIQLRWFDRWSTLIGQDKSHLMEILQDKRLPEKVRELAREPLLLYLLAAMHCDGELTLEMFEGAEGAQAKVLIYERTLDWVLTKQRAEGHRRNVETEETLIDKDLNPKITELAPEQLRRVLQEVGLCVVQSGMEFARIKAIEGRLRQDDTAKLFLQEAQCRLASNETPLRNALATFYLQEGQQGEGTIEFVHKSFGEFLCAERIVNGLINACQLGLNQEYTVDDNNFCWLMYDLLSCPVLTPEIVEYLIVLLTKHPDFKAENFHSRLYEFYWRWSDGEFIDAPPENLPQQKMRLLREHRTANKKFLGQRQVDMYTGLNIIILLWELHRYSLLKAGTIQTEVSDKSVLHKPLLPFHPCKRATDTEVTDPQRLFRIIGMSHCLGIDAFREYLGTRLGSTNLHDADLSGANLSGSSLCRADLSGAELRNTLLCNADLTLANLTKANLRGAVLHYAELDGTNLRDAELVDADLSVAVLINANLHSAVLINTDLHSAFLINADLSNANLINADLSDANLENADLSGAILSDSDGTVLWNDETYWAGVKGLESAVGVPEALKQQLGLHT